jgi:polar amino acid transport system substrate-binding protein
LLRYFLFCSCLLTFWIKADEQLLFVVNAPGSPPYLFFDNNQSKYMGVIPDILQGIKPFNIRFISNSRQRSEEQIYSKNADMMMLSKAWLKHPNKVVASISIHEHRSFLYRSKEFPENFSLKDSNISEFICTRKGYFYPNLAVFFNNKRLIRVDTSNHISMMKMLFKHRCDYTVMNEFNAQNVMQSPTFENQSIYRSELPISIVPLNIIMRSELDKEKIILDEHIRQLKENGKLKNIMKKYIQIHH